MLLRHMPQKHRRASDNLSLNAGHDLVGAGGG